MSHSHSHNTTPFHRCPPPPPAIAAFMANQIAQTSRNKQVAQRQRTGHQL